MPYLIRKADPRDPRARALLQASHDLMASLFSSDDCHQMSVEALCGPDVLFFGAFDGAALLGCGGVARREGYGEIKAMFTDPQARGRGVAAAILTRIETTARAEAIPCLRLETGVGLDAAIALYEATGFVARPAFGAYSDSPASLFYEKNLTALGG